MAFCAPDSLMRLSRSPEAYPGAMPQGDDHAASHGSVPQIEAYTTSLYRTVVLKRGVI